jgi:amidase
MGEVRLSDSLLALATLQQFARQLSRHFVDTDVWLTPVLAEPPAPLGTFDSPPDNPMEALMCAALDTPFTPVVNVTGQPAMSVPPVTSSTGLPIGMHRATILPMLPELRDRLAPLLGRHLPPR